MSNAIKRRYWAALASAVIATGLAIVWHWSALSRPLTHTIGWPGDNLAYVWLIHRFGQVVFAGEPLWFDRYSYYPVGYDMTVIESTLSNIILAFPIAALFGPVAGYNAVLLLSFALTALGMTLWVGHFVRNVWVAAVIGIASAFLPYRIAHLPGHLPLMATQWMPLCLFGVERYLATRRTRWALFSGLTFALNGLASWYYLVFLGILLPVYTTLRLRHVTRLDSGRLMRDLALGAAVAVLPILPVAFPYLEAVRAEQRARSLAEILAYSISPTDLVTLSVRHPLWGEWAKASLTIAEKQNIAEHVVMPGYLVLIAALCGVVLSRRRRAAFVLTAVAILSMVSAMGPLLVDHTRQPVRVTLPSPLGQWVQRVAATDAASAVLGEEITAQIHSHSTVVVLPYALVYQLPGLSSIRSVGRFAVLMNLALLALAGLGVEALALRLTRAVGTWRFRSFGRLTAALGIVFLGITLLEYWQKPYLSVDLSPRPIDRWLLERPGGALLELPFRYLIQRRAFLAHIHHKHPLVLGLGGSFPPSIDAERRRIINALPHPDSVQALCTWDTRFILVHTAGIVRADERKHWIETMRSLEQAKLQTEIDGILVYELTGCSTTRPMLLSR